MLIINADDFGRSAAETDAALRCYRTARLTSVSAMVTNWMWDCISTLLRDSLGIGFQKRLEIIMTR